MNILSELKNAWYLNREAEPSRLTSLSPGPSDPISGAKSNEFLVEEWSIQGEDHMRLVEVHEDEFYDVSSSCEVCEGSMSDFLKTQSQNGSSGLVRGICRQCTFMRFTRMPVEGWYESYFANDFYQDELETRPLPDVDRRIFDMTIPYLNKESKVFDFGCGLGEKTKPFTDYGLEVVGVETSSHRAEFASKFLSQDIHYLSGEEALRDEGIMRSAPFSLCILACVLEFLRDPLTALEQINGSLEEGGFVVISTGLFVRRNVVQEAHFAPIRSTFNALSLRLMLARTGFDEVESKKIGNNIYILGRKNSKVSSENVLNTIDGEERDRLLADMESHLQSEIMDDGGVGPSIFQTEWANGKRRVRMRTLSRSRDVINASFVYDGRVSLLVK